MHYFVAICECKLVLWSGKDQIGAKFALTSVTLTFDLWTWLFAWTSLLSMVITPGNFMMIQWQEHCEKGVKGGQMDRQMDGRREGQKCYWSCLVAVKKSSWCQLANCVCLHIDGLVQERRNSSANALELRLSCTDPSICETVLHVLTIAISSEWVQLEVLLALFTLANVIEHTLIALWDLTRL